MSAHIRLPLVVVAAALLLTAFQTTALAGDTWRCPTHPEYASHRPGRCPSDRVRLVQRISPLRRDSSRVVWASPTDPSYTSSRPGRSPSDRVRLLRVSGAHVHSHREPTHWVCPTRPSYRSSRPGRCPTDRVRLVARYSG